MFFLPDLSRQLESTFWLVSQLLVENYVVKMTLRTGGREMDDFQGLSNFHPVFSWIWNFLVKRSFYGFFSSISTFSPVSFFETSTFWSMLCHSLNVSLTTSYYFLSDFKTNKDRHFKLGTVALHIVLSNLTKWP